MTDGVKRVRRSCRDFSDAPVDDGDLQQVLAAPLRAPSAGNTWALDLVVLVGAEETGAYWHVTLPAGPRRSSFRWPGLLAAPVLIIPTVQASAYVRRYGEADKARTGLGDSAEGWPVPYWWVDGGAAVMAMLLVAEDVGLGALFFGQFADAPAVASRFGIPEDRAALGTIALGHRRADGRSSSDSVRRGRPPSETWVHHGRW